MSTRKNKKKLQRKHRNDTQLPIAKLKHQSHSATIINGRPKMILLDLTRTEKISRFTEVGTVDSVTCGEIFGRTPIRCRMWTELKG